MRYAGPSIIEALCEFVFVPERPWNGSGFERFGDVMAARLPVREQIEVMAIQVRNLAGNVEQAIAREPRLRLFSADRSHLAQVGANVLSANVLRPYPRWPAFRSFILEALRAYVHVSSARSVERMTLRYIDRITPPAQPAFRLGDWLKAGSDYVPGFLRDAATSGMNRLQKTIVGGLEVISVVLQADDGRTPTILLDSELVLHDLAIDERIVGEKLDTLHDRVIEIFEACISDRTRAILKPEAV